MGSDTPSKKVAIEVTSKSFLPEARAYRDYLEARGYRCELLETSEIHTSDADVVVLFHGLHPFWRKYPKRIVGEYHSLSTGRFPRLKDFVKSIINVRADCHVFLNEAVRERLWLVGSGRYIYRPMGFDGRMFARSATVRKIYDVAYCGSKRQGLVAEIRRLASYGLLVAVAGFDDPIEHENVVSFGSVSTERAALVMLSARVGLNFTPDVYPYNIQDSTKTIEYCAAGVGVLTNRYGWVNEFERTRGARFCDLDRVRSRSDVVDFDYRVPDVSDLEWDTLLDRCRFVDVVIRG